MPIDHHIDHARKLVVARGAGVVTDQEVFGYQRDVWSRPEVKGYDELVDMSDAQSFDFGSSDSARSLASLSASNDPPEGGGRLAIIAPSDAAFGIARMYRSYRELQAKTTKMVEVFRKREDAFAFLGIEDEVEGRA